MDILIKIETFWLMMLTLMIFNTIICFSEMIALILSSNLFISEREILIENYKHHRKIEIENFAK